MERSKKAKEMNKEKGWYGYWLDEVDLDCFNKKVPQARHRTIKQDEVAGESSAANREARSCKKENRKK